MSNVKTNQYGAEVLEPAIEAVDVIEMVPDTTGINVGKVLLTTAGVAAAAIGVVKLVKLGIEAYKNHKRAKALERPDTSHSGEDSSAPTDEVTE